MAEIAPLDRPGEFKLGFAGDTFNTAWYLARIAADIDVRYLTAVGDDKVSDDMRSFMRTSGISDAFVQQLAGETVGLYLIHLDRGERSFSYWRGQSAAKRLADDPLALQVAMAEVDLIYLSGITLAILDPKSRETLFAALRHARGEGKTIAFDTNLRPRLWSCVQDMQDTIMSAAELCDVVLPSFEDEAEWFGDDSPVETLNRYKQIGVKRVIVKNGDQSVIFDDEGKQGEVIVQPAKNVIDTTAAGDSFNAGVLASLLRRDTIIKGISNGCRLAGQVVQHKGALVPVEIDFATE